MARFSYRFTFKDPRLVFENPTESGPKEPVVTGTPEVSGEPIVPETVDPTAAATAAKAATAGGLEELGSLPPAARVEGEEFASLSFNPDAGFNDFLPPLPLPAIPEPTPLPLPGDEGLDGPILLPPSELQKQPEAAPPAELTGDILGVIETFRDMVGAGSAGELVSAQGALDSLNIAYASALPELQPKIIDAIGDIYLSGILKIQGGIFVFNSPTEAEETPVEADPNSPEALISEGKAAIDLLLAKSESPDEVDAMLDALGIRLADRANASRLYSEIEAYLVEKNGANGNKVEDANGKWWIATSSEAGFNFGPTDAPVEADPNSPEALISEGKAAIDLLLAKSESPDEVDAMLDALGIRLADRANASRLYSEIETYLVEQNGANGNKVEDADGQWWIATSSEAGFNFEKTEAPVEADPNSLDALTTEGRALIDNMLARAAMPEETDTMLDALGSRLADGAQANALFDAIEAYLVERNGTNGNKIEDEAGQWWILERAGEAGFNTSKTEAPKAAESETAIPDNIQRNIDAVIDLLSPSNAEALSAAEGALVALNVFYKKAEEPLKAKIVAALTDGMDTNVFKVDTSTGEIVVTIKTEKPAEKEKEKESELAEKLKPLEAQIRELQERVGKLEAREGAPNPETILAMLVALLAIIELGKRGDTAGALRGVEEAIMRFGLETGPDGRVRVSRDLGGTIEEIRLQVPEARETNEQQDLLKSTRYLLVILGRQNSGTNQLIENGGQVVRDIKDPKLASIFERLAQSRDAQEALLTGNKVMEATMKSQTVALINEARAYLGMTPLAEGSPAANAGPTDGSVRTTEAAPGQTTEAVRNSAQVQDAAADAIKNVPLGAKEGLANAINGLLSNFDKMNTGEKLLSTIALIIVAIVALTKDFFDGTGSGTTSSSSGEKPKPAETTEKEPEAPKMPEKFKNGIDAIRKDIKDGKPSSDREGFVKTIEKFKSTFDGWDSGFEKTEGFDSIEAVIKSKQETVKYVNEVFKKNISFKIENGDKAESTLSFTVLEPTATDEKPKEETPAATERFKEVEERQVIAVLDKLSLDGNLVPFLTFEFKEGKLVAKNSKGKEAITATFTAGGELKEAEITDADDLEVAKKESENLEEKTEEAFDELDIPEDLRSRIITEWKEPKLSLKDTEGKSLGWVEFDGSTAKTTHKEPANVAALQERIEAEKTKRPKELLRSLDKALDTSASLDGDGETVDSMAGRLIEALKGNKAEGKLYLKDGDLTDNDGNEVKADFQTLLEDGDYEEALQALIDVDTGSKDYRESVLKARHEVEMKKKTSIAVKDRWIDGSAVYLGQNGWEYKIGREGKMYARSNDGDPVEYQTYDETERAWKTLEKGVL